MAFTLNSEYTNTIARINLKGELDGSVADQFRDAVSEAVQHQPTRLVLDMTELDYMSSAGLRVLVFARQKMGGNVDIFIVGANEGIVETIEMTGMHHSVTLVATYDAAQFENPA